MKYLSYEDSYTKAGLWHLRSNFQFLIEEAHSAGRIPILPEILLSSHHNLGFEVRGDLSKYFDWRETRGRPYGTSLEEPLLVLGQADRDKLPSFQFALRVAPSTCLQSPNVERSPLVIKVVDECLSRRFHGLWRRMAQQTQPAVIEVTRIEFSREVSRVASKIVAAMGGENGYAAIHVRRGDKLEETDKFTTPETIARYLKEKVPKNIPIYLLTDESSLSYVLSIEDLYPIFHYRKFRALRAFVCNTPATRVLRRIGMCPPDNFMLYAVEMCLLKNAKIPIYSFRTPYSGYYLCDRDGWV